MNFVCWMDFCWRLFRIHTNWLRSKKSADIKAKPICLLCVWCFDSFNSLVVPLYSAIVCVYNTIYTQHPSDIACVPQSLYHTIRDQQEWVQQWNRHKWKFNLSIFNILYKRHTVPSIISQISYNIMKLNHTFLRTYLYTIFYMA